MGTNAAASEKWRGGEPREQQARSFLRSWGFKVRDRWGMGLPGGPWRMAVPLYLPVSLRSHGVGSVVVFGEICWVLMLVVVGASSKPAISTRHPNVV